VLKLQKHFADVNEDVRQVLISGAATAMWNGFRRVDAA